MNFSSNHSGPFWWRGDRKDLEVICDPMRDLANFNGVAFVVKIGDKLAISLEGEISSKFTHGALPCYGTLHPLVAAQLGSREFILEYGLEVAYMTGAMANGISSSQLVIAAGNAGFLGSFGSGSLSLDHIEKAIVEIQSTSPVIPYAFNLLNNPHQSQHEMALVKLYLQYGVRVIEASAFIQLSLPLVYFRVVGLGFDSSGAPKAANRVVAKISRPEVARRFMKPPPKNLVSTLLSERLITVEQANLAELFPMADDITVEADSGGHTDGRPLVALLPAIIDLRNKEHLENNLIKKVRVGAAGGISTPRSALAAFSMGAAYIVTGSINQVSVEAATSVLVKEMLGKAEMSDVVMAPAADMFELGAQVQVLKKGTMYAMNAQKLYQYYRRYNSVEELSLADIEIIESRILKRSINQVWEETMNYFQSVSMVELEKCKRNPKHKLALILRWYLGTSSKWAIKGDRARVVDYQIWCGQSLGAFNSWVLGSRLEKIENRGVAEMGREILEGVIGLKHIQRLSELGCSISDFSPETKVN